MSNEQLEEAIDAFQDAFMAAIKAAAQAKREAFAIALGKLLDEGEDPRAILMAMARVLRKD